MPGKFAIEGIQDMQFEESKMTEVIVASTKEVFATMFGEEATSGNARLERGASESFDGVVTLVGLAGDWAGVGSVGSA